jgi:prophage maintenance system killer protein
MNFSQVVQGNYFRYSILKDANLSTTIYEAAHSMVYMVRNQTFENGNHRTAILLLLDYLNSIGATYTADPLALYLELADPLRLSRAEAALFIDQLAATIEKSVTIIEKPVTDTEEPPATDIEGPASVSSRETDPTDRKTKKKEKKKKKKKPKTPKQPNVPSPNQSEFRKACALRVKFANKYWFAAKDNEARVRAAQRDYDNNKNRVGKSAADIQKLYDVLVAAKQNMKEEAAYWQVEPKGGWMNFKGGLGNQRGEDGEL